MLGGDAEAPAAHGECTRKTDTGPSGKNPEEAAPQPAAPWVGGWWLYMVHSPRALWVIPHRAVPPRERPGGTHGLSGRHMPGGGDTSDAVAAAEPRQCSQEVTL